jgi:hypothetical protein
MPPGPRPNPDPGTVAVVEFAREHIVEALRRAGLTADAEWAESSLPETCELDQLVNVLGKRGLSRGLLVDLLGGSP